MQKLNAFKHLAFAPRSLRCPVLPLLKRCNAWVNNSGYTGGDKQQVIRAMLLKQDGKCAACAVQMQHGRGANGYVLDHDHVSGGARGLLCRRCNLALGLLDDDPTKIKGLLQYIKKRPSEKLKPQPSTDDVNGMPWWHNDIASHRPPLDV